MSRYTEDLSDSGDVVRDRPAAGKSMGSRTIERSQSVQDQRTLWRKLSLDTGGLLLNSVLLGFP